MTNLLYDEFFAIAIAIAKRWFLWGFPLYDNQFPASGTDFSLNDGFETADRQIAKWPPTVQNGSPLCLGLIAHFTGTGKWPPYGGSSLDAEVFHPLECISMHFNGIFNFA